MSANDRYPIHTGYLTKSPPETRVTGNFKRWMRRWFVLWEDKSLQYYRERGDNKPKKTIDLNHCEFLDTNLTDKRFQNIFCIRVNSESERDGRTFYLAADSPYEMKAWVDVICKLCDFKAVENNNNDSGTIIRHKAPLDKDVSSTNGRERADSGILEPEPDTNDLVSVKIVNAESTCTSDYDSVPPPRPLKIDEKNHDVLTSQSPIKSPAGQRNSCPLDTSSSSESSLSSIKRSSGGSDTNFDVSSFEPTYDVPPSSEPTYDVPPEQTYDVPPEQTYDVPPEQNYVYPPPQRTPGISSISNYDVLPAYHIKNENRHSAGSNSDDGNDIYDVPPSTSTQSAYDIVPPPRSANISSTIPGITKIYPSHVNYDTPPSQVRVGPHYTLPSGGGGTQSVYDIVPARDDSRPESADFVPSNYDYVPPPKAKCSNGEDELPPVNREVKPAFQRKQAYVNLPLPNTFPDFQRDSGAILDDEDALYDVPPPHSGPVVNRVNKPSMPPRVDRNCKPGKFRDYVNIAPTRSATVRENSGPRRGANVQRSKSAAADFESEGYLYMESPKRTESSTRYSKKDKESSILKEEDEAYEFMSLQKDENDSSYENYQHGDALKPVPSKNESSTDRNPPLRGQYQDISVVCQSNQPTIPKRVPTQYTTIDYDKTRGLRKTYEDLGKA